MKKENTNKENITEINRREALGLIGKGVAAAAVTGVVLNATKDTSAQSANVLDFVIKDYRSFMRSSNSFWTSQIIVRSPDFNQQCSILFVKDGETIPMNTVSADGNNGMVHFPTSQTAEIREFLRYERPIRITVVGSNGIATISNDQDENPGDHDFKFRRLLNNTP